MPSARTVAAIFCATVSGEPTKRAPCSTSASNWSRVAGPQPRSAPIRSRLALKCGKSWSRASWSVSATNPGECTPTGCEVPPNSLRARR